jgi:general secretion pathway protein H
MKPKNGFTLIELLVVLGILVLSLSIIAPLLGNTIKNYQIKSATREIAAGLRETRSKAVNSETEKTLILDIRQKQYSIDTTMNKLDLPEDVAISLTTASSDLIDTETGAIRFFPDGSSTGARILLNDKSSGHFIDVNWLTGQISIKNWTPEVNNSN